MKRFYISAILCLCLFLGGCFNFSPKYAPPELPQNIPTEYKEEDGWKTATPKDALDRGSWWELFADSELNRLMDQLNVANQDIARAAANLRRARSQIGAARSAFFPGISLPASYTRSRRDNAAIGSSYSVGVSAEWEISFWNALPAFEAVKAEASATAADLATMRLSCQAELAQAYFDLCVLDERISLYEETIKAYEKALQLTQSQFQGGMVTRTDVAQAESTLAQAQAEHMGLLRQRAQMEHAVAILTGQIPSLFTLERGTLQARVPSVPLDMPSTLLERRPDIAAAERRVASANQQIGVARAAWFPALTLGGNRGIEAAGWHSSPITIWSLGPSAALSLFQGGKHLADSDAAWADYEASVADYRQTVLQAFKDVEDNLAALNYLDKEGEAQERAVESANTTLRLAMAQYQGGMTTYLQVVSAQATALNSQSAAIQVRGQKLVTAVNLIKALGGGWQGLEAGEE